LGELGEAACALGDGEDQFLGDGALGKFSPDVAANTAMEINLKTFFIISSKMKVSERLEYINLVARCLYCKIRRCGPGKF
jgi:hypothetical protein